MKILFSMLLAVFCFSLTNTAQAADTNDSGAEQRKVRFTKHFNETLFQITERREFSVEILPDDKEYKKLGRNVIGIVIHDKHDRDVEKADLNIVLFDDQGKDITGSPVISEKGHGLYTVAAANFELPQEGNGELRVRIKKGVEDTAVFSFPAAMKKLIPAGKY